MTVAVVGATNDVCTGDILHFIQGSHAWNLRKEFSGPGKSWKMTVVWKSRGIPPIIEFFSRMIIILAI